MPLRVEVVVKVTSKKIVSGKHPLTVRVSEELYRDLRVMAAEMNLSVNELIAGFAEKEARKRKK